MNTEKTDPAHMPFRELGVLVVVIAPNSRHVRKGSMKEFEGNADYGGMVQPSYQHIAPHVKRVE